MTSGLSSRPSTSAPRRGVAGSKKHALRLLEIAERRREAPGREAGAKMPKARQRKLRLHAPLVADKLVPFVDDDEGERSEGLPRPLLRQHEREAFGRRHQKPRRLFRQRRALSSPRCRRCGRRSATAQERLRRDAGESLAQRSLRVGGERAHRRDPEHAELRHPAPPFRSRQARRRTRPPASCPIPSSRGGARIWPSPMSRQVSRWNGKIVQPRRANQDLDRKRAIEDLRRRRRCRRAGPARRRDLAVVIVFRSHMAFQREPALERGQGQNASRSDG